MIRSMMWRHAPRLMLWARYVATFRALPRVRRPRTFNERILAKLLFDRDPRLTLFADKLAVRDYVSSRLGGDAYLTKLYATVATADAIRDLDLPERFVMKPNHMSGEVKIVTNGRATDRRELELLAASWLRRNYGHEHGEWAYRAIPPRVLFEELLEHGGRFADDYRFYCFGGVPRLIRVTRGRASADPTGTFYDTSFRPLHVASSRSYYRDTVIEEEPPGNLDELLDVAARLSREVDFVRVDLYDVGGRRIVFGELTNYPQSGAGKFEPPSWDVTIGAFWPRAS